MKHYATAPKDHPDSQGYPANMHGGDTLRLIRRATLHKPGGMAYCGRGGTGQAQREFKARILFRKWKAGLLPAESVGPVCRDNRTFFRKFEREAMNVSK